MGRVSRDARLLFIQLWPICDDHGRTRAASRMLASLLFPYDDDAPSLIDGWLSELEREGCIVVYEHEGSRYLQVCNWLKHQKIDKPSRPQFPAFDESSRILANPREHSLLDQGPRIKDQGSKNTVQPTAARFDEFWAAYPNKKGRATALAKWKAKKLDSRADEIIAHVRKMLDQDDGWQRGFVPMGSTYIHQERWTDEPKGPPNAAGSPPRPAQTNPGGSSPRKEETPQSRLEAAESYARDMVRLGQMGEAEAAEYVARYRKKCEVRI